MSSDGRGVRWSRRVLRDKGRIFGARENAGFVASFLSEMIVCQNGERFCVCFARGVNR